MTYTHHQPDNKTPDQWLLEEAKRLERVNAELLAALKAFDNCGLIATSGRTTDGRPSNCTCDVHPELDEALRIARAAIAKAEGTDR